MQFLARFSRGGRHSDDPRHERRVLPGPEDDDPFLYHRLVAQGVLGSGYVTDIGVGLHYRGVDMVEAVSEVVGAGAYFVERLPDGTVRETRVEPQVLAGASGSGQT
ncbi:MAG TPA: hypothetical protein VMS00_11355 [Acidimicrobiales bacterium]|nr:hypothetical protein [Acidimicrobiales bacterium]